MEIPPYPALQFRKHRFAKFRRQRLRRQWGNGVGAIILPQKTFQFALTINIRNGNFRNAAEKTAYKNRTHNSGLGPFCYSEL